MARIYDHVTDVMRKQIVDVLEARWAVNLLGLTDAERSQLIGWLPHLRPALAELKIDYRDGKKKSISIFSPPRCCRRRSVVAGRSFGTHRPSTSPPDAMTRLSKSWTAPTTLASGSTGTRSARGPATADSRRRGFVGVTGCAG